MKWVLNYIALEIFVASLLASSFALPCHAEEPQPPMASHALEQAAAGDTPQTGPTLAEIDRQLNNPLTSIWSLTFQENFSLNKGDRADGTDIGNTFFFQPALPIPLGKDMVFIARPVFPLVTNTILDPTSEDTANRKKTGFGDIQVLSLIGPDRKDGLVWGLGPTFKFPTASHDSLGQGKYQAGPAVMLLSIGKPWVLGGIAQHWWSYAGDSDRPVISRTDFQYIIRRQIPGAMSIGRLTAGTNSRFLSDWESPRRFAGEKFLSNYDLNLNTPSFVRTISAPPGIFVSKSPR